MSVMLMILHILGSIVLPKKNWNITVEAEVTEEIMPFFFFKYLDCYSKN